MTLLALSSDELDTLADYADEHGVRFPLLSDPDSEIIERFGILNTLIEADDHPWYGIPFPGTYVIDANGVIIAKFFEPNLALRASADQLRRAAIGKDVAFNESVGLVTLDSVRPLTREHVLNGTGDEFPVFDGDGVLRMPTRCVIFRAATGSNSRFRPVVAIFRSFAVRKVRPVWTPSRSFAV